MFNIAEAVVAVTLMWGHLPVPVSAGDTYFELHAVDTHSPGGFIQAPVSLSHAVRLAETRTQGLIVKAETVDRGGGAHYVISSVFDRQITTLSVNPATGATQTLGVKNISSEIKTPPGRRVYDEIRELLTPMSEVVEMAELFAEGWAKSAEIALNRGAIVFRIEVVGRDNVVAGIEFDAATGMFNWEEKPDQILEKAE